MKTKRQGIPAPCDLGAGCRYSRLPSTREPAQCLNCEHHAAKETRVYQSGGAWTTPEGIDDGGQCVVTRASKALLEPCEKDANLRLCAAAPDLLEACKRVFRVADTADLPGPVMLSIEERNLLRRAIEKAEGDAQ